MRSIATLLLLAVVFPTVHAEDGYHWKDDAEAGTADLYHGDQPLLRYMYASDTSSDERAHETYKVYHHAFGPGNKTIITKGPHGKYTHHRGLYVGWNKTKAGGKSYDFWHCNKGERIEHQKFVEISGDANSGRMTALVHWNDPEGKPVIEEMREVVVRRLGPDRTQIDWNTELWSRRGEIELNGDRQHAGFQFRAAQEVADRNSARYVRPEGFPQEPAAHQVGDKDNPPKHVNLPWLAMSYTVDGEQYTTEYHEAPGHPEPRRYSERPYGRFGSFFATKLTEKKPLYMRYRVVITHGPAPEQAEVQQRHDAFLADLKRGL